MNTRDSDITKIWQNFIPIWSAPFLLMLYSKFQISSDVINAVAGCFVIGVWGYGFYIPANLYRQNKMHYGVAVLGAVVIPFVLWALLLEVDEWFS